LRRAMRRVRHDPYSGRAINTAAAKQV